MTRASTIKISAAILLLLMILFFAVVSWCFFTERGARVSLGTLQRTLTNLHYQYESGNLANGLVLTDVSWTMKNNTRITADKATLKWNPRCWRGQEFCVSNADINQLTVTLVKPEVKKNPIQLKPVKVPFELVTDKLTINKLSINRPEKKTIELKNLQFSGRISDHTMIADSIQLEWLWLNAVASGEMNLIDNYPLALNGQFSHVENKQKFPLSGSFTLNGDLLSAELQSSQNQPFTSVMRGNISFLTRQLPIDLQLQWAQTQIPFKTDQPLFYLHNGNMNLNGFWPDYTIAGTVETSGPKLPVAMATIDGKLNTKQLNFHPLHLKTLNGDINANGQLLFGDGLEWQSTLSIEKLEPNRFWSIPRTLTSGTSVFNGRTNKGQTSLQLKDIDLQGTTGGFPYLLTGDLHRTPENDLQLHTVEIKNHNNTLTANGTLGETSDASVFFALREPGMFHPDVKGDLNGDLQVTGNIHAPQITGSASSSMLWFKNFRVTNTKVTGKVRTNNEEVSELNIAAQSASNGPRSIQNLAVTLSGSPENHYLKANFNGEPLSVSSMRMSGKLDEYRNWIGKIYKTNATITGQPVQLDTPLELTWVNGRNAVALQPHCWEVGESSVCVDAPALIGSDGTLDFSVDRLDLSTISPLLPDDISAAGILQSRGKLKWHQFKRPEAELLTSVQHGRVTITPPAAAKPVTFDLSTADLQVTTLRNKITSVLSVDTDKTGPIEANVAISLNNRTYPLRGTVTLGESPVQWIHEYFPALEFSKGSVISNFNLSGTLKAPRVDGQISLNNAAIDSPGIPTPLDNIQMELTVANDNISVTGSAESDGRPLSVTGNAQIENNDWTAKLNLQGDRINVRHKYLNSAVVSPDLNINLTKERISVDGRVTVPRAAITLPKIDNNGIPISDDIVIVDAVAKNDLNLNQRSTHPVRADIDIQLGNQVSFSGYGLDADLHGNMNVKIKPKRIPEVLGEVFIDKGTYRSYGQSLVIRDGRINFVGPLEQTNLSVEAVRNTGRVLAGLRVDGSLNDPQTTLFSEPPLPEEAILPYLVLGRPIDLGAEAADDSQLIANAALFMGITNGRSITQSLAANLGIDDFTMSATGSGEDTQVQLSGRLNDRLLVRYGLGVFNSVNTLFLRYDLAEQLYLETTQGLEKAVDLFYSFEFD